MPQGADPGSPRDEAPATATVPPAGDTPVGDPLGAKPVLEWTKDDWSRWIAQSPAVAAGPDARVDEAAAADEPVALSEGVEWVTPEVAVSEAGTDQPIDEEEPPERRRDVDPADAGEGGSDVVVAPDDPPPAAASEPAAVPMVEGAGPHVEPEAARDRAAAELLEELAMPSAAPREDGGPVPDVAADDDQVRRERVDERVPPAVGEVEPERMTSDAGDDGPGPERAPLAAGPESEWVRPRPSDTPPPPGAAAGEVSPPGERDWAPMPTPDDWPVDPASGAGATVAETEPVEADAPPSWWSEATGAPAGRERTAPRTSPATARLPTAVPPREVRLEPSHRVRSAFGLLGVAVLVGTVLAGLITVAIFVISVALRRAIG